MLNGIHSVRRVANAPALPYPDGVATNVDDRDVTAR
jgi:hypothetical protein